VTPVKIVIPDIGPLITLAQADALELLLCFDDNVRIVLTDYVEFEATRRHREFEDAQRICDFLSKHAGRIEIEETSYGKQMKAIDAQRRKYEESAQVRKVYAEMNLPPPPQIPDNAGELSIVSYATSLIDEPPGPPCLVIAEDDFFLRSNSGALPGNAHIVSTHVFLQAIERLGKIGSAESIWSAALAKGRKANPAIVDLPARKIPDITGSTAS